MKNELKNSANEEPENRLWKRPEIKPDEIESDLKDLEQLAVQVKKNLKADFEKKLSDRNQNNL